MATEYVKRETREVGSFDKITLKGVGRVIVTQGEPQSLEVEAQEEVLSSIVTEVQDSTLVISYTADWSRLVVIPLRPIRFHVTMPDVKRLEISGAGKIEADNVETNALAVVIRSAGAITAKSLAAETLKVTISGAGGTKIDGKVGRQEVTISGAGGHDAGDLESTSCAVTVKGAGGATVWVRDDLKVRISGVGGVRYYGSPKVTRRVGGLGGVSRLGDR